MSESMSTLERRGWSRLSSRGAAGLAALRRPRYALTALAGLIGVVVLAVGGLLGWQMHEDAVAASAAVGAVKSFDPTKPAGMSRLNDAAVKRGSVVPALAPYLRDSNRDRRFAAIYVAQLAAQNGQDARVLATALDDPDPAYRVMAAGSLAGLGEVRSIPVLIEGLASNASLPHSDPPRPVADLAREALEAYTGQSFPDVQGWRAWWSSVKSKLHWNGSAYVS